MILRRLEHGGGVGVVLAVIERGGHVNHLAYRRVAECAIAELGRHEDWLTPFISEALGREFRIAGPLRIENILLEGTLIRLQETAD